MHECPTSAFGNVREKLDSEPEEKDSHLSALVAHKDDKRQQQPSNQTQASASPFFLPVKFSSFPRYVAGPVAMREERT
jgi:hypothetical protein